MAEAVAAPRQRHSFPRSPLNGCPSNQTRCTLFHSASTRHTQMLPCRAHSTHSRSRPRSSDNPRAYPRGCGCTSCCARPHTGRGVVPLAQSLAVAMAEAQMLDVRSTRTRPAAAQPAPCSCSELPQQQAVLGPRSARSQSQGRQPWCLHTAAHTSRYANKDARREASSGCALCAMNLSWHVQVGQVVHLRAPTCRSRARPCMHDAGRPRTRRRARAAPPAPGDERRQSRHCTNCPPCVVF